MSAGFLFWLLMILWAVTMVIVAAGHIAGIVASWPVIFLWVLLGLLGWKVFGAAVHQ